MKTLSHIEEKRLKSIIEQNPFNAGPLFRLATLMEAGGRRSEAVEAYGQVISLDPHHNEAYSRHLALSSPPLDSKALQYIMPRGYESLAVSPFLYNEQTWGVMKKDTDMALVPKSLRYQGIEREILGWSRLLVERDLENQGFRAGGRLTLRKDISLRGPESLLIETGVNSDGLFEELNRRIPLIIKEIREEAGLTISYPELRMAPDLPLERFRIFQGDRLLFRGGVKKGYLLQISESAPGNGAVETYCEFMGRRAWWVEAPDSGSLVYDHAAIVARSIHHAVVKNLHLFLDSGEGLFEFLRKVRRKFPWEQILSSYSPGTTADLLRYFISHGGGIDRVMSLFEMLADFAEQPPDIYSLKKLIAVLLERLDPPFSAADKEKLAFVSLSAETEEKILDFLEKSEPMEAFPNLWEIGSRISRFTAALAGKSPVLICNSGIRPFLEDICAGAQPGLPICSMECLPDGVETMLIPDESSMEPPLSHSGIPLFLPGANPAWEASQMPLASLMKGGNRSFLYCPGAGKGSSIHDRLAALQEMDYHLEGFYMLEPTGTETESIPEYALPQAISVRAGRRAANILMQDPQFQKMASFLRETILREYGILPPEIELMHEPSLEDDEYIISMGITASERERLPGFLFEPDARRLTSITGGKEKRSATDHIMDHLLAILENNLAALLDHETIISFREQVETESPGRDWSGISSERIHDILSGLLEERVPIKNRVAIVKEILRSKNEKVEDIVEKLRIELRDDIALNISQRYGALRFIELNRDMEIVLSSSLFVSSCDAADSTQEREYLGKLITNSYMAQEGSQERLPLLCSRSSRRLVRDLIHPLIPDLLVISKDEAAGRGTIYVEGIIEPPRRFLKFIIDEVLKQGIMSDYEEEEEKTLIEIRRILRENSEKGHEEHDEEEYVSPTYLTLRTGDPSLLRDKGETGPAQGMLLFLREWMMQAEGRLVPEIRIIHDEELEIGECEVSFEDSWGAQFVIPSGNPFGADSAEGSQESMKPDEVVLLHLFGALRSASRYFKPLKALEERIIDEARSSGLNPERFRRVLEDLLAEGLHPNLILDALGFHRSEICLLGDDAQKELIRTFSAEKTVNYFCSEDRRLYAVTLDSEMESYISGCLKDFDEDRLLLRTPESLQNIALIIESTLQDLVSAGYHPVLVTERIPVSFLSRLTARTSPCARIFKRGTLPPDIEVMPFLVLKMPGRLFAEDSSPESPAGIMITVPDYQLFSALISDFRGDYRTSLSYYDQIMEKFPLHPTALWRGAFCAQRMGNLKVATNYRKKAMKAYPGIDMLEPGYYLPGKKRASLEADLYREPGEPGPNRAVAEYRHAICTYLGGGTSGPLKTLKRLQKSLKFDDELYSFLGLMLMEKESFGESRECFRKALRLNPSNRDAETGMAAIHSEESQYDLCWSIYGRLLKANPGSPDLLKSLGYTSMDRDDYQSTLQIAGALIRADREDYIGLYMRSKAHHYLGDLEEEIKDLREALKLDPGSILLNRTYGEILWQAELFDEARHHLTQVFKVREDATYTTFHRARILMDLGDLITAKKLLMKASREAPGSTLNHLMGELALKMGSPEEAGEYFRKASRQNPSSLIYELALAEFELLSGDRQIAEARYRKILGMNPEWALAYPRLAILMAERGDIEPALRLLREGMGYCPEYPELYTTYFSLPHSMEELQDWECRFRERIDLDPQNSSFHFSLALVLTLQGSLQDAMEELERAYLISPESTHSVEYLCRLHMMEKDAEKALVVLRVALKKNLRSSRLYFLEGMCWKSLGNAARAKESFSRASQHDPLFPYSLVSRGHLHLLKGEPAEAENQARAALQYNGLFGPALLLLGEIYRGTPREGAYVSNARTLNAPETWGITVPQSQ